MTKYVSPNFVRASNLILVSAALGVGMYFITGSLTAFFQLFIFAIAILLIVVLALLIRQGYAWAKWVFTILTIISLIPLYHSLPEAFQRSALVGWLSVIQNVLDIVAIVLLFLPSKQPLIDSTETTVI